MPTIGPKHGIPGFIRLINLTGKRVSGIVEGKEHDPSFYEKTLTATAEATGVSPNDIGVFPPSHFIKDSGGKNFLRLIAEFMDESGHADGRFTLGSSKSSIVIFIDKDADDVRGLSFSPTMIPTRFYNIENHLLLWSCLKTSASISASIPSHLADSRFPSTILTDLANSWRDYVIFCITISRLNISHLRGYGVPLPPDQFLITQTTIDTIASAGMFSVSFAENEINKSRVFVDQLFAKGEQDAVLNGKWYFSQIPIVIQHHFPNSNHKAIRHGLPSVLICHLLIDPLLDYYQPKLKPYFDHAYSA